MKFSLWPAGIRIPQKYNVHTHDGCEEYQGEYVSSFFFEIGKKLKFLSSSLMKL